MRGLLAVITTPHRLTHLWIICVLLVYSLCTICQPPLDLHPHQDQSGSPPPPSPFVTVDMDGEPPAQMMEVDGEVVVPFVDVSVPAAAAATTADPLAPNGGVYFVQGGQPVPFDSMSGGVYVVPGQQYNSSYLASGPAVLYNTSGSGVDYCLDLNAPNVYHPFQVCLAFPLFGGVASCVRMRTNVSFVWCRWVRSWCR